MFISKHDAIITPTANHAAAISYISIDARLHLRNWTISVKAETSECLVARDSIIA